MATVLPNQGAFTRFIARELSKRLLLGAVTDIGCKRGPVSPVKERSLPFRTRVPIAGRACETGKDLSLTGLTEPIVTSCIYSRPEEEPFA